MSDYDQGSQQPAGSANPTPNGHPAASYQTGHHALEPPAGDAGAPLRSGPQAQAPQPESRGHQHVPLSPAAPAAGSGAPAEPLPGGGGAAVGSERLDLDEAPPTRAPEAPEQPATPGADSSASSPETSAETSAGSPEPIGAEAPAAPLPRTHVPLGAINPAPEAPSGPAGEPLSTEPEASDVLDEEGLRAIESVAASALEEAFSAQSVGGDLYGDALEEVDDLHDTATTLAGPDLQAGVNPRHMLESWLAQMVEARASDLILRAGGRPSCRVDGRITFLPGKVPGAGALTEVLEGIVGPSRMQEWRKLGSTDVALQLDGLGRFRLNAYRQIGEPALVLRRIAETPPKLEALCLPTGMLQKLAKRTRGIVLVTGVAGSGKSTTLAAMIQHMNETSERHVITLEDPVELMFQEDRCVISQREVGTDVPDFSAGLRHCLRQSPDVILIGEMRDAETVQAALDATETGHLVFSTLHTVNAAQTVDRIISFFPQEQHEQVRARLADNVAAVLSQRLLPRSSGQGMVPALELMTSTPRIMELLGEGRTIEISREIEAGEGGGLISFNQSLRQLVEAGLIELEVALSASDRPEELLLGLRGFNTASARNQTATGSEPRPQLRLDDHRDELTLS